METDFFRDGNTMFPLLVVDEDRGSQTLAAKDSPRRLVKPRTSRRLQSFGFSRWNRAWNCISNKFPADSAAGPHSQNRYKCKYLMTGLFSPLQFFLLSSTTHKICHLNHFEAGSSVHSYYFASRTLFILQNWDSVLIKQCLTISTPLSPWQPPFYFWSPWLWLRTS